MSTLYLWIKVVHLLATVLFLGNIYTGLYWKAIADRTGDVRIQAHTLQGIVTSDRWFTIPGVLLIVISGVSAAVMGRYRILAVGWIAWSIAAFVLSGLLFAWRLAPVQAKLRDCAVEAARGAVFDRERYRRLSLEWEIWGVITLFLPLLALVFMTVRPVIPGLGG